MVIIIITTVVVNNNLDKLINLGLSENEAKAYLALLTASPSTAYETAKEAGIPTSKIYEVLEKLTLKNLAVPLENEGKKRYIPQPPEEFVEGTRQHFNTTLNALKKDLMTLGSGKEASYIWNLSDYDSLIEKATRMIQKAEKTIMISAWAQETLLLENLLKTADEKGIKTSLVLFGEEKFNLPVVFPHPIKDTIYEDHGGRGLVVICDSKEALLGTVREDGSVEGAWSLNNGFVILAEDYVKHDVYIMKIVQRLDSKLIQLFGPGYALLRDIFSDKEVEP